MRVVFRNVQRWAQQPASTARPGVYCDGRWVGDILQGNAFHPTQLRVLGVTSPRFERKPDAKGNVRSAIRRALAEWTKEIVRNQNAPLH